MSKGSTSVVDNGMSLHPPSPDSPPPPPPRRLTDSQGSIILGPWDHMIRFVQSTQAKEYQTMKWFCRALREKGDEKKGCGVARQRKEGAHMMSGGRGLDLLSRFSSPPRLTCTELYLFSPVLLSISLSLLSLCFCFFISLHIVALPDLLPRWTPSPRLHHGVDR